MSRPDLSGIQSRFVTVEGARTHFLESGSGPTVVLLHAGEFGGCAEASWYAVIPGLAAAGYHVFAPDWLGFGRTDKLIDFADPHGRRLRHMAAFLHHLGLEEPALIGNSMGATYLARDLASEAPHFSPAAVVLISGGGFVPHNEARKVLLSYDLTEAAMAAILRVACQTDRWASDPDYVAWRYELSLEPGAWQAVASGRLSPPDATVRSDFGQPDTINYEVIGVPVLIIAGAQDRLRLPGYADEIAKRVRDAELLTYDECGHLPNIEHPGRLVGDVTDFLERRYRIAARP